MSWLEEKNKSQGLEKWKEEVRIPLAQNLEKEPSRV